MNSTKVSIPEPTQLYRRFVEPREKSKTGIVKMKGTSPILAHQNVLTFVSPILPPLRSPRHMRNAKTSDPATRISRLPTSLLHTPSTTETNHEGNNRGENVINPNLCVKSVAHESSRITRRRVLKQLTAAAVVTLLPASPPVRHSAQAADVPLTTSHQVYLDISIAGRPADRVTIELFDQAAPATTKTFKSLASGTLRDRTGQTAGYRYAQASRVLKGKCVYLGRLNQIDAANQSPGTPQRLQRLVQFPVNSDNNDITHDKAGLVSMPKGGNFEFAILAQPMPELNETNIVIGRVVNGMETVEKLVNVPTNKKTIRDGYRKIGQVIGDARANVPVRWIAMSDRQD